VLTQVTADHVPEELFGPVAIVFRVRSEDEAVPLVNGVRAASVELPFSGVKRSGIGRELGRLGIEEFVNKKLVRDIDRGRNGSPFRRRDVTRQLLNNVEHRRSGAAQKAV
jgi:acyl-CoA reductase-like NAD-dependent aldehyde dehydrogenase